MPDTPTSKPTELPDPTPGWLRIRIACIGDMDVITPMARDLEFSLRGENLSTFDECHARIIDAAFGPFPSTQIFLMELPAEQSSTAGLAFINRVFPGERHRHGIRINNLYVVPQYRDRLLPFYFGSWLIRHAIEKDYSRIVWNTPVSHRGENMMYRAAGFDGEDQEMIRLTYDRFEATLSKVETMLSRLNTQAQ